MSDLIKTIGDVFTSFGVQRELLLASLVNFAIVLIVLRLFAYKPLLKILEERKKRIAEGMANVEKIKQELAATQEQRAKALGEANVQAQRLIDEARKAADQVKDRTVAEARTAAEAELRRAQQQIVIERERMLTEARQEITALVINTTAKVAGKVLTAEDQRRLAEETNREIAA